MDAFPSSVSETLDAWPAEYSYKFMEEVYEDTLIIKRARKGHGWKK
jgi:hypothetical protein